MSATTTSIRARSTAQARRAHLESLLIVVLSFACLAMAIADLVLLATYSA